MSANWSPDGRTIVFQASLDIVGESGVNYAKEIFTLDFDTTGFAANGGVALNQGLHR